MSMALNKRLGVPGEEIETLAFRRGLSHSRGESDLPNDEGDDACDQSGQITPIRPEPLR